MTQQVGSVVDLAVRVSRAAPLFDRLVSLVLSDPSYPVAAGAASHPLVRECLDGFFPEFRQLFGELLLAHIGAADATQVLAALEQEAVQRYLRALQDMEPELCVGLNQLSTRMVVALQERGLIAAGAVEP